jgi:hypothetical protein
MVSVKVAGTEKKSATPKKKITVPKHEFDSVLQRLIQTKPQKRTGNKK